MARTGEGELRGRRRARAGRSEEAGAGRLQGLSLLHGRSEHQSRQTGVSTRDPVPVTGSTSRPSCGRGVRSWLKGKNSSILDGPAELVSHSRSECSELGSLQLAIHGEGHLTSLIAEAGKLRPPSQEAKEHPRAEDGNRCRTDSFADTVSCRRLPNADGGKTGAPYEFSKRVLGVDVVIHPYFVHGITPYRRRTVAGSLGGNAFGRNA